EEVFGAGPFPMNAAADVFDAGAAECESGGSGYAFAAQEEGRTSIPYRDALEIVMIGTHEVEQDSVAATVEHNLAVAGGDNRDRLICCSVGEKVVRAIESSRQTRLFWRAIPIEMRIVLVDAGMDQNGVSRPYARR